MRYLFLLCALTARLTFAQDLNPLPADSQLPGSIAREYQLRDSLQHPLAGPALQEPSPEMIYRLPAEQQPVRLRSLILPASLIGFGALSLADQSLHKTNERLKEAIQSEYAGFSTKIDNYTRYVPLAAVYGLNLAGVHGRHNVVDLSMLYVMSSFMSRTLTANMKKFTKEQRPDHSTFDSFPSQHTASAFAKAELLRLEFKHRSPWYGIAGYSFAVATGGLRMLNNRHWFSDVVAGAGVGILSTRVAYLIYPWLQDRIAQGRLRDLAIAPMYQDGAFGLGLAFRPAASSRKH